MGYIESYSRKAKTKQYVPTYPDGSKGVRATMNNMGLDNSKIGWKDGSVTYGKISFKPSAVKDGVSYAPTSDIQGFVNDIYRSEGKNPVRITDYVSPSGLGSVSYSNNGMVSVGGENIPILYMDGDRAVVDSNLLDSAYNKLSKKTGIDSAADMYGGWRSRYGGRLDTAYGNMTSDKKWSYNPETDPAYQAYSRMYQREGERAYRDAAAKMASRKNNGGMTSAAQTLANSQLAYYMSKLTDMIPELEKNSYERYMDEYQKSKDAYNALADMANAAGTKRKVRRSLQERITEIRFRMRKTVRIMKSNAEKISTSSPKMKEMRMPTFKMPPGIMPKNAASLQRKKQSFGTFPKKRTAPT